MACPTCDHTMQSLGTTQKSELHYFWCPRCGTLRCESNGMEPLVDRPSLPHRVRAFLWGNPLPPEQVALALKIGLEESCTLPAERKLG